MMCLKKYNLCYSSIGTYKSDESISAPKPDQRYLNVIRADESDGSVAALQPDQRYLSSIRTYEPDVEWAQD